MIDLVMAVAAFLVTHSVPALPKVRAALIRRLGRAGYMLGYSVLSLGVLVWMVLAFRQAPYVPVWDYDPVLNWVPLILMPVACMAAVAGLAEANPFSLSLWSVDRAVQSFDPHRPGLLALTRHPALWGFAVWAVAHMVPNGDVASLILFGLLAVLAVGGMMGLDAKRRRSLGADHWSDLAARTSLWPGVALWQKAALRLTRRQGWGGVIGLLLYGLLLSLHQWIIGVSPLPW